jgi:hypothetical protein
MDAVRESRARMVVAAVLLVDAALVIWGAAQLVADEAEAGGDRLRALCVSAVVIAPIILALVALLRRRNVDGAAVALAVTWFLSVIVPMFMLVALVMSASATGVSATLQYVAAFAFVQLLAPAAVRWAREPLSLLRAYVQTALKHALVFLCVLVFWVLR